MGFYFKVRWGKMLDRFKEYIAAVQDDGQKITYSEINKFSDKISRIIKERSVVFSFCRNTIGSLVGYLSFINNKIVPLMLSSNLDKDLFENLYEVYSPQYIWAPKDMEIEGMSVLLEEYGYCLYGTGKILYPLYEELGLLLTTSGSTGSPKLVRQSYSNILANTKSIVEYLQITSDERPITTLPMNYTYGLSIINTHIYSGATIYLTEKTILEKQFWDFFAKYHITSFGGVPYTYEMLDRFRFWNRDLPSLVTMTQAGGKLSPELHKKFAEYAEKNGKHFVVMYGQTEATARMAYLPYEKSLEKYGSMGIAIPGGEFQIIDIEGNVIEEAEQVGELLYRGENVTLGYAEKKEDLARGDERRGVLITGDMAKKDKDGYYYIVGRKKRFLKMFGNRVNLDELERMIKKEYSEIDCACVGKDDNMSIFVTIADKEAQKKIKKFVANKTKLNPTAFHIFYTEAIPKNDSGKTLYSKLQIE